MREGCIFCLKWRCLRGSSALNLLDFAMNVLCCIQVILVFTYSEIMKKTLIEMHDNEEYVDNANSLLLYDLLNGF